MEISLGGKPFLTVKVEESKPTPDTEMILVQNRFEEFKRLCPTGKSLLVMSRASCAATTPASFTLDNTNSQQIR